MYKSLSFIQAPLCLIAFLGLATQNLKDGFTIAFIFFIFFIFVTYL